MDHSQQLKAFVKELFDDIADWPEGGSVDGFELQDVAVKHGILIGEKRFKPCGEFCNCNEYFSDDEWEDGITCYHRAEWLNDITNYTRPELTETDLNQARTYVAQQIRKFGMGKMKDMLIAAIIENVKLTKEINEHRAARGIEPLKTYEV